MCKEDKMPVDIDKTALDNTLKFIQRTRERESQDTGRDLINQISKKTRDFIDRVRKIEEGKKRKP